MESHRTPRRQCRKKTCRIQMQVFVRERVWVFGIRNIGRVFLGLLIISFVVSSLLISPLKEIFICDIII